MPSAAATASSSVSSSPVPASIGMSTARAASRAVCFEPNSSSCAGVGPTNAMPAASAARAKPAFSQRNP